MKCLVCCLLFIPSHAYAQAGTDSVSTDMQSESVVSASQSGSTVQSAQDRDDDAVKARVVTFRPKDVQVQDRYRPTEKDSLFPKKHWQRLFIGLGGGFQGLSDNVESLGNSHVFGYLGYKFSPIHSLRLHGSYTTFNFGLGNSKTASSLGIGVDYLTNITNYAWGYDPSRLIDVSSVVGVGTRINSTALGHRMAPYGYLGAHVDFHISSYFSLFAEPYVGVHKRMNALFGRSNREMWNLMYGANIGMQMAMERRSDRFAKSDSIYRSFFFDSSAGVVANGRGGGVFHRIGHGYQGALGMWINPMLGLRLGMQAQSFHSSSSMTTVQGARVRRATNEALVGARAEVMLNPLNFSKRWREKPGGHDFDLNVLFGGDFGGVVKSDVRNVADAPFRAYYYGLTGAVQALYRISNPGTYIFFEPRYVSARYDMPDANTNSSRSVSEHNISLNVGTRIYMTNAFSKADPEDGFVPHWWAGLDFGAVRMQRAQVLTNNGIDISPTVGLSLGYDLSRYASFRAQLAYQRLYDTHTSSYLGYDADGVSHRGNGLWNSSYNVMDMRLAYMLNLNNVLQGYDSNRRFNLWMTAGPSFSFITSQSDEWVEGQKNTLPTLSTYKLGDSREGKFSPGVAASLMATLRVAPQYDVSVEAMGQYNFTPWTNPGDRGRLNNLKYGITVGGRYHFEQGELYDFFHSSGTFAESDSVYRHFFFDSSYGLVVPGRSGGIAHRAGHGYQAGLGMWINPLFGLRLGIHAETFRRSTTTTKAYGPSVRSSVYEALGGGRLELLVNPLNFSRTWREKSGGHDFDLNLSFGGDLGWDVNGRLTRSKGTKHDFYYGFTTALQALYRISKPGTYIFFEPRYLAAMQSVPYTNTDVYHTETQHRLSFNVGTRLYMTNAFSKADSNDEFVPHWWAGLDVGGIKLQRASSLSTGGIGWNPSFGLSLGYDWKRYASFRAQLAYQRLYNTHNSSYLGYDVDGNKHGGRGLWNSAYNLMDLRLSYMLNLNNLLQGYDSDRRFNLWLTAGPSFSLITGQSDEWVEGQKKELPEMSQYKLNSNNEGNFSPGLSASLMATMRVTPRYDVSVEAMGQYNFIHNTNPGNKGKLNNLKYGLSVGGRYHFEQGELYDFFHSSGTFAESDSVYRHFFFDSSYGLVVPGRSGGIAHRAGHGYQAGLGMWINPLFGLRLGIHAETFRRSTTTTKAYGPSVRSSVYEALGGGRVELLVNPLNFSRTWREKSGGHNFDLNLSFGGDFGWDVNGRLTRSKGTKHDFYYGFTSALQVLYRISKPGTYIFVEPRYLAAMQSMPNTSLDVSRTETQHRLSFNVGTRIYMTNAFSKADSNDEFVPHWWAGLDVGGIKLQRANSLSTGGIGWNPSFGLSLGYDWKRYASFRAQLAYQRLYDTHNSSYLGYDADGNKHGGRGLWNSAYNLMDLRLSYMLNLNNLLQGYDSDRRFNLWLTAGPSFSFITGQSNEWVEGQKKELPEMSQYKLNSNDEGNFSPGLSASLMATMRVASRFDVSVEAMGQYNFIHNTNPGNKGKLNNLKYGLSVGGRYHFEQGDIHDFFTGLDAKPWQKGWELDASYGWVIPFGTGLGAHGTGTRLSMSTGYWFNSILGARLGLMAQQTYYGEKPVSGDYTAYQAHYMLGGRAEVMLNPLNFLRSRRELDKAPRWDVNLSAGLNFGGMGKASIKTAGGYVGFTASAALLYRLSNVAQLYLEPRYDMYSYDKHNALLDYDQSFTDRMFTLSVGTRITRPVDESRDSKRPTKAEEMAHRGLWLSAGVGGTKMLQRERLSDGGMNIQPSAGVSVGYDFTRLSGVRASFVYGMQSRLRTNQPYTVVESGTQRRHRGTMNTTFHQMDMQVLYMLNLTNLWTGYDKRNAFNVYFEAGPAFAMNLSQSNSLAKGETMSGTDFRYIGHDYGSKKSFALASGLMMTLPVTKHWDISAELLGHFYFNRGYMPEYSPQFLNGIKMNFSVGTRYNF